MRPPRFQSLRNKPQCSLPQRCLSCHHQGIRRRPPSAGHRPATSHQQTQRSGIAPATLGLIILAFAALLALYFSLSDGAGSTATRTKDYGTLIVRTSTGNAEVRINAELIGKTPIEKELRAGRVSVLCSFRDREVVLKQRVDVMAGQRTETLCQLGVADLEVKGHVGLASPSG